MSLRPGWLPGAVLLTLPRDTWAHSPIEGINDFYNGLLHPLLVPAQGLLLLALGLWLGQRELAQNRGAVIAFVIAVLAGLVLSANAGVDWLGAAQLAGAVVAGLLVAAASNPPAITYAIAGALAGFVVALDSAPEALAGGARWLALAGTALGVALLLLYAMGLSAWCQRQEWQRIGVRVAGSWIAASALMVLALTLAPGRS